MTTRSDIERLIAAHGAGDLSADAVFELLSARRRRYLLESLAEHGYSLTLADLADEVSARECEEHIADIAEEQVLEVYLSLYHQHVPKLADADVVAYDQDQDLVARDENAVLLERAMDAVLEN